MDFLRTAYDSPATPVQKKVGSEDEKKVMQCRRRLHAFDLISTFSHYM